MKKLTIISNMCQSISQSVDENEIKANLLNKKDHIEEEIQYLGQNTEQVSKLLDILFPQDISVGYEFYQILSKILPCLGFDESGYRLMGILWSEAYQRLPSHSRETLLNLWVDKEVQFWDNLQALPTFLSSVEVPAAFASSWFLKIENIVQGNLAGGDFFRGVENYAFNFPSAGLTIFDQYLKDGLDDVRLHLAAIILGAVRAKSTKENILKETVNKWDVKASQKTELRRCYYRSWEISFRRGEVSKNKLGLVLDKAIEGTIEEQNEAFDVVRRCSSGRMEEEFAHFIFQWLSKNVSSELSPDAKYSVADTVYKLRDLQGKNKALIDTDDANKLILSIQPIEREYINIWEKVERYLVHRLHENTASFGKILKQIADKNPETLIKLFIDNKLEYLISEMNRIGVPQLIADCIFSRSDTIRKLGNILLHKIEIETLSDGMVKQISDRELRLALWESIRMPFADSKKTTRLLLMIEPLVLSLPDSELRDEFENEMVLQAINYPGACLKEWKEIEKPSDLLKQVIAKAEGYFEKQKKFRDSPANSFQFPEYMEATEKGRQFFSQLFLETRDKSLMSQIVSTVDLIYGNLFILSQGEPGEIGEPMPLEELSFQVEMPRLERIQPESMALRRFEAEQKIRRLQDEGT